MAEKKQIGQEEYYGEATPEDIAREVKKSPKTPDEVKAYFQKKIDEEEKKPLSEQDEILIAEYKKRRDNPEEFLRGEPTLVLKTRFLEQQLPRAQESAFETMRRLFLTYINVPRDFMSEVKLQEEDKASKYLDTMSGEPKKEMSEILSLLEQLTSEATALELRPIIESIIDEESPTAEKAQKISKEINRHLETEGNGEIFDEVGMRIMHLFILGRVQDNWSSTAAKHIQAFSPEGSQKFLDFVTKIRTKLYPLLEKAKDIRFSNKDVDRMDKYLEEMGFIFDGRKYIELEHR